MHLALFCLATLVVLELLLYSPLWRWRKPLSQILLVLELVSYVLLLVSWPNVISILVAFIGAYRLINLWRSAKQHVQVDHLYRSARETSLELVGYQAILICVALFTGKVEVRAWLYALTVLQLLVAAWLAILTAKHLKKMASASSVPPLVDKDLPSLTVAIPARNETEELKGCLESLVASNYPKLEIVVLDDCSQNKRTPAIIRSYANSGVRFISGEVPPERWLAKNYAYKQLAAAGSGELMLFCGTDVRFEPNSLKSIVELMLAKNKQMLCLIPQNVPDNSSILKPLLLQPARYSWEVVLPRKWLGRPPVLSSCWLIETKTLHSAGGFEAVSKKIIPESYFARQISKNSDGYSFTLAGKFLPLLSKKAFSEQQSTAIRTKYPQLHRRIELVALITLLEVFIFIWPIIALIIGLGAVLWPLVAISVLGFMLNMFWYSKIISLTYRRFLLLSLLAAPLAAAYDIAMHNYSMWQYEFGEVLWKGRNVCLPVMSVEPATTANSVQKA